MKEFWEVMRKSIVSCFFWLTVYKALRSSNVHTLQVRLIVGCILGPVNIALALKVAHEFGWLEFRILGASHQMKSMLRYFSAKKWTMYYKRLWTFCMSFMLLVNWNFRCCCDIMIVILLMPFCWWQCTISASSSMPTWACGHTSLYYDSYAASGDLFHHLYIRLSSLLFFCSSVDRCDAQITSQTLCMVSFHWLLASEQVQTDSPHLTISAHHSTPVVSLKNCAVSLICRREVISGRRPPVCWSLDVRPSCSATVADRSLAAAGPRIWNGLSEDVTSAFVSLNIHVITD